MQPNYNMEVSMEKEVIEKLAEVQKLLRGGYIDAAYDLVGEVIDLYSRGDCLNNPATTSKVEISLSGKRLT
jgi:hypothetical protein